MSDSDLLIPKPPAPEPRQPAEHPTVERRANRAFWIGVGALVVAALSALFTYLQWKAANRAVDVADHARIDANTVAATQRQDSLNALHQQEVDSASALAVQTKLADRSAEQAKRSATAAETANKLAMSAMRQAQRPWIGPDIKTPVITGPILIDQRGIITTSYQLTAVSYGNFGANNINFWAQLYVAQDIKTIWDRAKYACSVATGNPNMGRVMFPGQERIMTNPWPALAMDVIPNTNATPPQKEYQVYLLTCIGYRDQFREPHHTGTIFRSVRPDNGETLLFELTSNQSIPVVWREWHSFLD